MNLYCDIINQRFVMGSRLTAEVKPFFTQNDDAPIKVYLLTPARDGGRFPFMYDENSGKAGVTAYASLSNPGGSPLTLVAPAELAIIPNGFDGTLHFNTSEIGAFLAGRETREAAFSIEITDADGNRLTSFMAYVILRAASTEAGTVTIPGVVRLPLITGYTGGGPTNLDGIVTVGKTVGTLYWVKINSAESHWEYVGPGAIPSDPDSGIILTTDGGQLYRTIGL